MKTIAFSSIKGGVGKTSILTLLALYLKDCGKRVLLIDLDIQNSLTFQFTDEFEIVEEYNIVRALNHGAIEKNIIPSPIEGIDIIPSHFSLTTIRAINPKQLSRSLSDWENNYDYCLIDTSPNFDNHVLSAWLTADLIITPTRLGLFEYKSLLFMQDQLILESKEKLANWLICLNFHSKRFEKSVKAQEYLDIYQESFKNILPYKLNATSLVPQITDYGVRITTAKSKRAVYDFVQALAQTIESFKEVAHE